MSSASASGTDGSCARSPKGGGTSVRSVPALARRCPSLYCAGSAPRCKAALSGVPPCRTRTLIPRYAAVTRATAARVWQHSSAACRRAGVPSSPALLVLSPATARAAFPAALWRRVRLRQWRRFAVGLAAAPPDPCFRELCTERRVGLRVYAVHAVVLVHAGSADGGGTVSRLTRAHAAAQNDPCA